MKATRLIMGMPITMNIVDASVTQEDISAIFDYFSYIDNTFSTYKENSEISNINKGHIAKEQYSEDMKEIFMLAEQTKKETNGYFDISHHGTIDPSGIVKGWAIQKVSDLLLKKGFHNFFIDAGGDVQVSGLNEKRKGWKIGIRNPFNRNENVKVITINNKGVATSGTAIGGQHIYNPHDKESRITHPKGTSFTEWANYELQKIIVSITVIGPNIYEADRFATAAFAMGEQGIHFIESLPGFEGYMIDIHGMATYTSGFERYVFVTN